MGSETAFIRSTHDQTTLYSSTEWEGAWEHLLLSDELWAFDVFWGGRVRFLQGSGSGRIYSTSGPHIQKCMDSMNWVTG